MMKKIIFPLIIIFLVFAAPILAQTLYFASSADKYTVGDVFRVDVLLDTDQISANTGEIWLEFDPQLLELKDTGKGKSVFTLWIQNAEISQNNVLSFIGGTPGGFEGKSNLLSLYFEAKKSGLTNIIFQDGSKILLNDGLGTQIKPVLQKINILILPGDGKINELEGDLTTDSIPPENLEGKIEKNNTVFDGKYFIVFSATDRQSGIDHFEIKEGKGDWKEVKSPYLLENQSLSGRILVKAVDRAGNETILEVFLPDKKAPLLPIALLITIIVILAAFLKFKCSKKFEKP